MAPLILTLRLDDEARERFDRERRAHFPPDRLVVGAHLTLFHQLPGEERPTVDADLEAAARRSTFPVEVTGLRSLGRGVAYELRSPDLDGLRAGLAGRWAPWLTAQDRQRHRPHVTVQNKVAPAVAAATLAELSAVFVPLVVTAVGLDLWRYLGGPWEHVAHHAFGSDGDEPPVG